jgi:hypothetical protein
MLKQGFYISNHAYVISSIEEEKDIYLLSYTQKQQGRNGITYINEKELFEYIEKNYLLDCNYWQVSKS